MAPLCVQCGSPLALRRGIEVGNIFQLGTRYTEATKAYYSDESGEARPIYMGSYGIGVGRLLACLAEEHRDEHGLKLPLSVAPYHVALLSLCRSSEGIEKAESLYESLQAAGIEVLFDDRDASAGVKFADADLRGLPFQLLISDRSLKDGNVELKVRETGERRLLPYVDAVEELARAVQEASTL